MQKKFESKPEHTKLLGLFFAPQSTLNLPSLKEKNFPLLIKELQRSAPVTELKFKEFLSGVEQPKPQVNESLKEKKIHPAIKYFRQLHTIAPSSQLKELLLCFAEPKSIDSETFTEGVKKFIQLAHVNPLDNPSIEGGKALYGTIYSGLHYNNELANLWNAEHINHEPVRFSQLITLVPPRWNSSFQDGCITLVYKGQQPAQALDELVMGPTTIDCGMFTQLSLWFGLRYMLGNERFNRCFGRAPFFITQHCYTDIINSNKPHYGNPLYSFLSKKEAVKDFAVSVRYLKNTPLYPLKHPGGNYRGENCILIDQKYYLFKPHLEDLQGIPEFAVLRLLRQTFNEKISASDRDRLSLYAENPEKFHREHQQTYGQLIEAAELLRDKKISEEESMDVEQDPALELVFDLHKFSTWFEQLEKNMQTDTTDYSPLLVDSSLLPAELLNVIPFENRTSMDFSLFKQETPQQKELMIMSKQFCQSIMAEESRLVILTGKAGVGKTASAACAAKELATRGKKVVWISEVMVKAWAAQARNIADLDKCEHAIDNLLASDPAAVFLDDDNLAGFSGNLLLEKVYAWYVNNPGKGLFITSNEPITFNHCYGYKLDKKFHFPPFNAYNSPQYLNWQHKADLAGISLRSRREGQSIGAIVSDLSWKTNEGNLGQVELIPAFDYMEEIEPICQSLFETGSIECSAYHKLRPIQKRWINVHNAGGGSLFSGDGRIHYVKPYLRANPSKFKATPYKTIALEMNESSFPGSEKKINDTAIDQLIHVLNYAHDQGGRRIILINHTRYSAEQLLIHIKAQLPKPELERTGSRLKLLLCETEDTIFKYEQFNGTLVETTPHADLQSVRSKTSFFSEDNARQNAIPSSIPERRMQQNGTKTKIIL